MDLRLGRTIILLFLLLAAASLVTTTGGSSARPRLHASAAQAAPPIVVRQLRFLGFGRDVVGRGRSARPNGERDGHFSVVLAAPKGPSSVRGLVFARCIPNPKVCSWNPTQVLAATTATVSWRPRNCRGRCAARWPRPALLAVFASGKRLNITPGNKKSWLRLPRSGKGVRLDLYVNDGPGCTPSECGKPGPDGRVDVWDRRFAPGHGFGVFVLPLPKRPLGPWTILPGPKAGPSTPLVAFRSLRYLGLGKDVVGRTPGTPPNGEPDAHWSLDFATPAGPLYLWGVHLERYHADPTEPIPWAWTVDGSNLSSGLAVFLGETRLKLEDSDPEHCGYECGPDPENWLDLRWSTKTVSLDLYANDRAPGAFTPGQRFQATVYGCPPYWARGKCRWAKTAWVTLPTG